MWIQVVKVQSAWAWPLLEREVTPKNREKGKQPEREHSTYICSIFKLRSGNPKFIIFTTCFFSYMSEIFHKYKKFLSHTPKKSCLPGRTVPAWPLIHQCRWMSHKKKKTDIGIKDIQIPFLMVARGRAWGQVKEKKKNLAFWERSFGSMLSENKMTCSQHWCRVKRLTSMWKPAQTTTSRPCYM